MQTSPRRRPRRSPRRSRRRSWRRPAGTTAHAAPASSPTPSASWSGSTSAPPLPPPGAPDVARVAPYVFTARDAEGGEVEIEMHEVTGALTVRASSPEIQDAAGKQKVTLNATVHLREQDTLRLRRWIVERVLEPNK